MSTIQFRYRLDTVLLTIFYFSREVHHNVLIGPFHLAQLLAPDPAGQLVFFHAERVAPLSAHLAVHAAQGKGLGLWNPLSCLPFGRPAVVLLEELRGSRRCCDSGSRGKKVGESSERLQIREFKKKEKKDSYQGKYLVLLNRMEYA